MFSSMRAQFCATPSVLGVGLLRLALRLRLCSWVAVLAHARAEFAFCLPCLSAVA